MYNTCIFWSQNNWRWILHNFNLKKNTSFPLLSLLSHVPLQFTIIWTPSLPQQKYDKDQVDFLDTQQSTLWHPDISSYNHLHRLRLCIALTTDINTDTSTDINTDSNRDINTDSNDNTSRDSGLEKNMTLIFFILIWLFSQCNETFVVATGQVLRLIPFGSACALLKKIFIAFF